MAQSVQVCDIDEDVPKKIKKFRFKRSDSISALLLKVDPKTRTVVLEEEYEDTNIEELQGELPPQQPRFIILSYVKNHSDGRKSYPLCFIYICPLGCKPELAMMYAGTRNVLRQNLDITKDFELRSAEDFTTDWLEEKLNFF
ncbi:hypothetical protein ACF0H5_002393 [Mactra antiquata]